MRAGFSFYLSLSLSHTHVGCTVRRGEVQEFVHQFWDLYSRVDVVVTPQAAHIFAFTNIHT